MLTAEACGWLDISGGVERLSTSTFRYQAKPDVTHMTRSLQERPNAIAGQWFRNTAELSGELSVGDVLVFTDTMNQPGGSVTETAYLACESSGWFIVPGSELLILDPEAAERVIRERYGFEPAESLSITVPLNED